EQARDGCECEPAFPPGPELGHQPEPEGGHHSALNARPGRTRAATSPGTTATRLATITVAGISSNNRRIGTWGAGTMPRWRANAIHAHLPAATPNGTPIAMAAMARVVACQATAVRTCRGTNPNVLTIASSRPRRRIDVTKRW